jgi:hypothetical protein
MAGQVLRMNVNGRLTAPPQVEVALVTNSVDDMVSEGRNSRPRTRGTTLAFSSFGTGSRTRTLRGTLRVGTVRCFERSVSDALLHAPGLQKFDPVSAAHRLSASREAAARS